MHYYVLGISIYKQLGISSCSICMQNKLHCNFLSQLTFDGIHSLDKYITLMKKFYDYQIGVNVIYDKFEFYYKLQNFFEKDTLSTIGTTG